MNFELNAALGGLRAGIDLLRVAVAARDDAKANEVLQDMSMRLTDALMSGLAAAEKSVALQSALSQAQREKAEVEEKLRDQSMYAIHELRAGAFALRFQPQVQGVQPAHYLCQTCNGEGFKVILQTSLDGDVLNCPRNAAHCVRLRDDPQILDPDV